MHKKSFSLINGNCLEEERFKIAIYLVKIEKNYVYIGFLE